MKYNRHEKGQYVADFVVDEARSRFSNKFILTTFVLCILNFNFLFIFLVLSSILAARGKYDGCGRRNTYAADLWLHERRAERLLFLWGAVGGCFMLALVIVFALSMQDAHSALYFASSFVPTLLIVAIIWSVNIIYLKVWYHFYKRHRATIFGA